MIFSGKDKGFGNQEPADNGIATKLREFFAGSLAICEPWFGGGSIVLARGSPSFKVRVMNDQQRCLVALFEMVRVDEEGLFELVKSDEPSKDEKAMVMIDDKSPFLASLSDVAHGIAGFFTCIENLGIHRATAIESSSSFFAIIREIHDLLESVLVENMPVDEFIPRFDKSYTAFFLPLREALSINDEQTIPPCFATLQGRLLVQVDASSIDAFKTRFSTWVQDRMMLDFELRGENGVCYLGFKARA
jgi:hypothetical protein